MITSGKKSLTLRYYANFAPMFFALFTGISGILISQETLTSFAAANLPFWTLLHVWSSYITMAIIAIHVGKHMEMIVAIAAADQTDTQDTVSSQSAAETADTSPTLAEFLNGLICTACHRNCPLSAPQCGRADPQIQSAEEEYTQLYESITDIEITVGDTSYVLNLS